MNALASLFGIPKTHTRIESIHFETLTERTLALSPHTPVRNGRVYLALVRPDGGVVGRWFAVAPPREDARYEEHARRQRGTLYVTIPVEKDDWLSNELALRSRKGDRVLCAVPSTAHRRQSQWPAAVTGL